MRSILIVSVVTLLSWGVISADDTSKPVAKEPSLSAPALQPQKETEVPTPVTTQKPLELPKPAPKNTSEQFSSHMAPAPSTGTTVTTPRVVNADQVLYERAAWQARQRIARIEQRKWTGQSLSRPTIIYPTYAALNPYIGGYNYSPYGFYGPAYRPYPWW
ncbi:MAG: hypothetical protein U0903_08720 [Planctomycetales bacterium]